MRCMAPWQKQLEPRAEDGDLVQAFNLVASENKETAAPGVPVDAQ